MRLFFKIAVLTIFTVSLQAGFFSDLFNSISGSDNQKEIEVEEEEIDANRYLNQEESVFSDEEQEEIYDDPSEYSKQKRVFLSFIKYPKKVYLNQHFVIEIKAVIAEDDIDSISTLFVNGKYFKIINPASEWKSIGEKSFVNRFYFKLVSKDAKLPVIRVRATNRDSITFIEDIKPKPLKIIKLKNGEFFSGVIARNLSVVSHKEKRYDDKSNLVLMEVNASMANLEDFHLSYALREALDSLKDELDHQSMYYVSVVPNYQKEFKFKYFNLTTNSFNKITFPIILSDLTLSTQLGLNPKKSKFFLYKIVALFTISFIFLLLFLKYRNKLLLFISALIAIYTIYTKLITGTILIGKDINIRILPTSNSTIFFKTPNKIEAKVLLKKDGYTKVLLPNGKIGWIRDDDLTKN